MKDSLPKNWVEVNLESIVDKMTNGANLTQYDVRDDQNRYPISRIETISDEIVNFNKVKYVNATEEHLNKYSLKKGDILFSHINSDKHLGKTAIFDFPEVLLHGINLLLIRSNSFYNPFLLNYCFKYYRLEGKFIEIAQRAVNQSSINQSKLRIFKFPLPPLAEQQRIVAKLDALFGQLGTIKKSLENVPVLLKNFRQQVLTQAVTGKLTEEWREGKELEEWNSTLLKTLLTEPPKNGAYYPSSQYGSGTRIIRIDSFYDGELKFWDKVQKVLISKNDYDTYKLIEDNILINRVNSMSHLGKCLLVKNLPEPAIFESNMMRLSIDCNYAYPEYLKFFFISNVGLRELRKNAKQAVNQASINQTDVMSVEVSLPPLEEQQEIVRRVESLFAKADAIEAQYITLKEKIDKLPQAILHKAFKGELTEQLDTDGDARDLLKAIEALKAGAGKTTKTKKNKPSATLDEVKMVAEP